MRGICLLGIGLLASGCAAELAAVETDAAKVLISDQQEGQLGLQVKSELETKQGIRYIEDSSINNYVSGVANQVIAFANRDRPGVAWSVRVIDDPKTVNAFATPGGYLYVYSGLLLAADNEAELAGVMAHETGHVVARHAARNMVDAYGLEAVTALAVGNNPGLLAQLAAGIADKGLLLAHSRRDEDEADEYGARYASLAGYDPHGLVTFFQKLKAQEGNTPKILAYLSDHPATPDRIDHINQLIASKHLGGSELGAARFTPVKQSVARRPPPPPRAPGGSAPPSGGAPPPN